jgi:hypothetical protein
VGEEMKEVTLEYCLEAYKRNWISICKDGQVVGFQNEIKDQQTVRTC